MLRERFRLGEDACKPNNGNTARKRSIRKIKQAIPKYPKRGKHVNHLLTQCLASEEAGQYFVSFRNKPLKHKIFQAQVIKHFDQFENKVGEFFLEPLEKLQADIQAAQNRIEEVKTDKTKAKYQKVLDAKLVQFGRLSRKASSFTRHSRVGVKAYLKTIRLRVLDSKYDKSMHSWITRCEPSSLIYGGIS